MWGFAPPAGEKLRPWSLDPARGCCSGHRSGRGRLTTLAVCHLWAAAIHAGTPLAWWGSAACADGSGGLCGQPSRCVCSVPWRVLGLGRACVCSPSKEGGIPGGRFNVHLRLVRRHPPSSLALWVLAVGPKGLYGRVGTAGPSAAREKGELGSMSAPPSSLGGVCRPAVWRYRPRRLVA